jgi:hypothetical protein
MDTSSAKLWLPGISDPDTLNAAATLCGTTAMKETRTGLGRHHDHRDVYARHPVMTPEMIRQLPDRYALLVRGGMSPVIARLPMAWKDPTYRTARRRRQATAVLTSIREPEALPGDIPPPRDPWPGWDTNPRGIPSAVTPDDTSRYPWQ